MRSDFCVFIISYKRAEKLRTVRSLKAANYTGDYFLVLGNDDPTVEDYREKFGNDHIIIFDKKQQAETDDTCDNFGQLKSALYARNACFRLAKERKYNYFLVLDDDYGRFAYRYLTNEHKLRTAYIQEFDTVCDLMLEFLQTSGATSIAMAQNGDFMGGGSSTTNIANRGYSRKVMNSFFCCTAKPFEFIGTINEDTNAYCVLGNRGHLFFTIGLLAVDQSKTQQKKGGLTDTYLDLGTYVKSFYTVMNCPSFVTLGALGNLWPRFHHYVNWECGVPLILSDKYKKKQEN